MNTVQDRIYAGPPSSQPDGYYNHAAAYLAVPHAWRVEYDDVIHDNNDDDYKAKDYCSTSHRMKGGHLKERQAKFDVGDVVEVLYDEDEDTEPEWYEATVLKKIEYQDDIRYNVHYHIDDAIQSNVREGKIRASTKPPPKKKSTSTKKKKAAAAKKSDGKKSKKRPAPDEGTSTPTKKKKKKANKKKKKKEPKIEDAVMGAEEADEGDPPWRTYGHDYIGKRVRWTPPSEEGDTDAPHPIEGTVVGWISERDVDSEGNPGFISFKTGAPANLFHAVFDDIDQDFEAWELEGCFV